MKPTAILFSRYRAFKDELKIRLAPINLIIGKNGGGKSVIARLPVLIAGALSSDAEEPINLSSGGVTHANRFEDLIYQRSAQPFMLGAEISNGDVTFEFKTTLRYIVEKHSLGIESFTLVKDGLTWVSMNLSSPDQLGLLPAAFDIMFDGEVIKSQTVHFVGIFPNAVPGVQVLSFLLAELRQQFESAFHNPCYLGPFRSERGALSRNPRQGSRTLGPRGERTLDVVGDNAMRADGALVREIEDWFEMAMGSRVFLDTTGGIPRLLVKDSVRSLDVAIEETGAGFAQVLPVAVQIFALQSKVLDSVFSIVEQPELHLHPAVHGAVADLFVQSIVTNPSSIIQICETHSEQFVTRIKRRIAEGILPASAVQILSIGHQSSPDDRVESIRSIEMDEFGNTDTWPVGVFDEVLDDLVQMREATNRKIDAEVLDIDNSHN